MLSNTISFLRDHLFTMPVLAKFAVGMVMLVIIPRLSRRLHVPVPVGLLLSGVLVGPYVLDIFGKVRPIADFLAELGKLLLMFFAGLEINLELFRRARNRCERARSRWRFFCCRHDAARSPHQCVWASPGRLDALDRAHRNPWLLERPSDRREASAHVGQRPRLYPAAHATRGRDSARHSP